MFRARVSCVCRACHVCRFQKVDTVSVFVEDNMGGKERTRIRRIRFIGDTYQKVMIDLTNDK